MEFDVTENDLLGLVKAYSPALADVVRRYLAELAAAAAPDSVVPDGAAVVAKSDLELLLGSGDTTWTAAERSARNRLEAAAKGYSRGDPYVEPGDERTFSNPLPWSREQAARKAHEMYWYAIPHSPHWASPGVAKLWQDIVDMILERAKVAL
jgi:hypothetical protein